MAGATKLDILAARQIICDEYVGLQESLSTSAGLGSYKWVLDKSDGILKLSVDGGAFINIANAGGFLPVASGATLNAAYNAGGPGAGRTILANFDAVLINKSSVDANNAFEINVTAGTGAAIQKRGFEEMLVPYAPPAVAPPGAARLYTDGVNLLFSVNGSAYAPIGTGSGGSLDDGYNTAPTGAPLTGAGRTILANAGAVRINKTIADANNAFEVNVTGGTGLAISVVAGNISCKNAGGVGSERFGSGAALVAANTNSTVIGVPNSIFAGPNVTMLGSNISSLSFGATVIGVTSQAARQSVAIGVNASAIGNESVGIGEGVNIPLGADGSVAVGRQSSSTALYGAAVGQSATAGQTAVAMGYTATAAQDGTAVGRQTNATTLAVAVGSQAQATALDAIAIGDQSAATANYAIAIGSGSLSQTMNSIAIGQGSIVAPAMLGNLIAIGTGATAAAPGALAFGTGALSAGLNSLAIGFLPTSNGLYSIAIGSNAASTFNGSIALGSGTTATAANQFICGSSTSPIEIVRFEGNAGAGLGAVHEYTDGTSQGVSAVGECRLRYNSTTPALEVSYNGAAYVPLSVGGGPVTLQTAYNNGNVIDLSAAAGPVNITNTTAFDSSLLTLTQNATKSQTALIVVAGTGGAAEFNNGWISCPDGGGTSERFGYFAVAGGNNSVAVGRATSAIANSSVVIGCQSASYAVGGTVVGFSSIIPIAGASGSTMIGAFNNTSQPNTIILGSNNNISANASNPIIIGNGVTLGPSNVNCTIIGSPGVGVGIATTDLVAIGSNQNLGGGGAAAVVIGSQITGYGSSGVVIGSGASTSALASGCVVVGANATSGGGGNVVIGSGAGVGLSGGCVCIGSSAAAANGSIGIGASCAVGGGPAGGCLGVGNAITITASTTIGVGHSIQMSEPNTIAIGGSNVIPAGATRGIAIGHALSMTATNTNCLWIIGSYVSLPAASSTSDVFVGGGLTLAGSGGSGVGIGYGITLSGSSVTAIGHGVTATGGSSVVIGQGANDNGNSGCTIVGVGALVAPPGGADCVAIGRVATISPNSQNSVAVGCNSSASGAGATALGRSAVASGASSTAIGSSTQANGASAVAVGSGTLGGASNVTVVGAGSNVSETRAIAIGQGLTIAAGATLPIVIGTGTTGLTAVQADCTIIGHNIVLTPLANTRCIAIGNACSIGGAVDVIAIGTAAGCGGTNSIAIGNLSGVGIAGSSFAIGHGASSTQASIAIGNSASAGGGPMGNCVVIGHGAASTASNQFLCGSATFAINIVRFVGNTGSGLGAVYEFTNGTAHAVSAANECRLRYNPATPALEVSYNGAPYVALGTGGGGTLNAAYLLGNTISISAAARPVAISNAGAYASSLLTLAQNASVSTTTMTISGGTGLALDVSGGTGIRTTTGLTSPGAGGSSERLGLNATVAGASSISIGNGCSCGGVQAISIGMSASNAATNSVGVGWAATITAGGTQSTMVGGGVSCTASDSVGIGYGASISGSYSVGIGATSSVTATSGIAIGHESVCGHTSSIAIGRRASSSQANQMIIGASGYGITQVLIGNGSTNPTPQGFTLTTTSGSGSVNGANILIYPGNGGAVGNRSGAVVIGSRAAGAGSFTNQIVVTGGVGGYGRLALGTNVTSETLGSGVEIQGTSFGINGVTTTGANPYTITDSDYLIIYTTAGGTLTLPNAAGRAGRMIKIKNMGGGAALTINTAGGNIDGAAPPFSLGATRGGLTFMSDGANWFITDYNS